MAQVITLDLIKKFQIPGQLTNKDKDELIDALDKLIEKIILSPATDDVTCTLNRRLNNEKFKDFLIAVAKEDYPGIKALPANANSGGDQGVFWKTYEQFLPLIEEVDQQYFKNTTTFLDETFIAYLKDYTNSNHIMNAVVIARLIFRSNNTHDYIRLLNQYDLLKQLDADMTMDLQKSISINLERHIKFLLTHHITLNQYEKYNLIRVFSSDIFPDIPKKYPRVDNVIGFRTAMALEQKLRTEFLASTTTKTLSADILNEMVTANELYPEQSFCELLSAKKKHIQQLNIQICSLKKIKKNKCGDDYMCSVLTTEIKNLTRMKSFNEQILDQFKKGN